MTARQDRLAEARTWAGYRSAAFARETGTMIVVVDGDACDLDTDAGRWQTICDDHGTIISHTTLALARSHASNPLGWCEDCAATDVPEEDPMPGPTTREPNEYGFVHDVVGVTCADCGETFPYPARRYTLGEPDGSVQRAHRRRCPVAPRDVPIPVRCNA